MENYHSIKDKVIYNILKGNKEEAISLLKELAKYYHIKVRKIKHPPQQQKAFMDFIINEKGYKETINNLYNSLWKQN